MGQPRLAELYLIQHRSLVPRLQSDFELAVMGGLPRTRNAFEAFCIEQAHYQIRFYEKWIKDPAPNRLVITYESLVEDTRAALAAAVQFVSGDDRPDVALVAEIAKTSTEGVVPRDPHVHPFYDSAFFARLETMVLDRCGAEAMRFHFIKP